MALLGWVIIFGNSTLIVGQDASLPHTFTDQRGYRKKSMSIWWHIKKVCISLSFVAINTFADGHKSH